MVTTSVNKELIKLRNLSSAFSRNAFVDVLNYNAYSHFNWLASKYDTLKCTTISKTIDNKEFDEVLDY